MVNDGVKSSTNQNWYAVNAYTVNDECSMFNWVPKDILEICGELFRCIKTNDLDHSCWVEQGERKVNGFNGYWASRALIDWLIAG